MDKLAKRIARTAQNAVEMSESRDGEKLDFTVTSLVLLDAMIAEAAMFASQMTLDEVDTLAQDFGSYILEVGRRGHGGRYQWDDERDQPVLVVGQPAFRVSLMTWDKVRSRLTGDMSDNIPFFYEGFTERVRDARPGTDVLYV